MDITSLTASITLIQLTCLMFFLNEVEKEIQIQSILDPNLKDQ